MHQHAFLAAICERPEDDTARLVYADWLDDNGDAPRAEFIRTQVRLTSMPPYHPETIDLEEIALDLLAEHRSAWVAHLPEWVREARLTFRRGFVAGIETTPAHLFQHGDRLAQVVPLEQVALAGKVMCAGDLARLDLVNRVVELDLSRTDLG